MAWLLSCREAPLDHVKQKEHMRHRLSHVGRGADQLAMTVSCTVKALDELGLVDPTHKADAVTKVGEVWQTLVVTRWVHSDWSAHNWY